MTWVAVFVAVTGVAAVSAADQPRAIQFNIVPGGGQYMVNGEHIFAYDGAIAPAYESTATGRNYLDTETITNAGGLGVLNSGRDGTYWNTVTKTKLAAGEYLCYTNGDRADGVTYGCAYSSGKGIEWNWYPGGGYIGIGGNWNDPPYPSQTGVQSTTLMGTEMDGLNAWGFYVHGLAKGTYQVFLLSATPGYESRTSQVWAGVFQAANRAELELIDVDAPGFSPAYTKGAAVSNATEWEAGKNYLVLNIEITSPDDTLVIITKSTGYPSIGLNGLQIVPVVPEPATMTLLGLGGLALLRRRR